MHNGQEIFKATKTRRRKVMSSQGDRGVAGGEDGYISGTKGLPVGGHSNHKDLGKVMYRLYSCVNVFRSQESRQLITFISWRLGAFVAVHI